MEKEVRILTKEQLDAYFDYKLAEHWLIVDANNYGQHEQLEKFRKDNPCPLPPPVKVLTSQLQPPVISAHDFLKEKGYNLTQYFAKTIGENRYGVYLPDLLTEYLQRQGQKPGSEISLFETKELCHKAIYKYPDKVKAYQNGESGLLGLFMGEVMKLSQGKANPESVNKILKMELKNQNKL